MAMYHHYTTPELHPIHPATNFITAIERGHLSYQMNASVRILEQELLSEGDPHALQIDLSNFEAQDSWALYADGLEVCRGNKRFAEDCFAKNATEFKDALRRDLVSIGLPAIGVQGYRVLAAAERIAAIKAS